MIVTCPECGARYRLADDAIPPEGRAMRCASCSHRWYQAAPDVPIQLPEALKQEFSVQSESTAPALTMTPPAPPPPPQPAPAPAMTPEQLAWTPADTDEAERPPTPSRVWLKNLVAIVLGLVFAAGAAALWVPNLDMSHLALPRVDLRQLPWLDRIVNPPPPAKSPLGVNYIVDRRALADGRPLFVITGTIINPTASQQRIPPLDGRFVDERGSVTYRWSIPAPVATLAPNQRVAFNASAVGQPYGGEHVMLDFAH